MKYLESAILGIMQGLTEFLPVSSSGHLVFMKNLLGIGNVEVLFDIFLHIGTLVAVMIFLREDLLKIISTFSRYVFSNNIKNNSPGAIAKTQLMWKNPETKMLFLIIIASCPTGLIALLGKNYFEKMFNNVEIVSCFLLITGTLLFVSERVYRLVPSGVVEKSSSREKIRVSDALIIGFMQGLAIAPGISRSGSTISAGIFRRINRELAARFSFLLSIPAILGAFIFEIKDYKQMLFQVDIISLLLGTGLAFISGYLALKILFRIIKKHRLDIFAYYCWILGLFFLTKSLIFS